MADTPLAGSLPSPAAAVFAWARSAVFGWPAALAAILVIAAVLRFNGLDWDQANGGDAPQQLHPDERFLSITSSQLRWPGFDDYFNTEESTLNPYNAPDVNSYVYGTLPLFLGKAIAAVDDNNGYESTVTSARRLTAAFDVATVLLVFLLGWALFDRRVGLVGALLYALAVLPTQLAHFWTVDPYLTFFGVATLLQAVLLLRAKGDRTAWLLAVGAGITLGLALACKVNGGLFLVAPLAAVAARIAMRQWPGLGLRLHGEEPGRAGHWMTDISLLCATVAVAIAIFRVAQPYAFEGPNVWNMGLNPEWRTDMRRELESQNGDAEYPPFIQFAGRMPVVTPLVNTVVWGLGPGLGVAAFGAIAALTVLLFRRRDMALPPPLLFTAAVLAFQGPRFVAFMRYFEPVYPVLCVAAAWAVVGVAVYAKRRWRTQDRIRWRRLALPERFLAWGAAAGVGVLLAGAAWWALAFQGVYAREHSRIEASRWIYENVPAGESITYELWDDSLPLNLGLDGAQSRYRIIETEPYEPDTPDKIRELVYGRPRDAGRGGLDAADYVTITSNRVRESVKRLEREYPATIRYYELLDSGELGFERVATFTSHPSFLGLSLNDQGAEESFTVYDHPEVRIYRKTDAWDPERALALLNEAHPERAVNLLPKQGKTNGLQLTADEARVQQEGGTFTDVFDADGWASHAPWLWWLLWLEVAAFAVLPWTTLLFRVLPDRGYGLSKAVGFGASGLAAWMVVAWDLVDFSAGLSWAVLGIFFITGAAVGAARWQTMLREARERWQTWLAMEAVFLAVFFGFLILRAYNPDLWHHPQGGEKPMEIAYLTAVTKSTEMPPYDPWFGGGSMNYYYMGWFLLAVPIRALKLVPEVAFNLGVPTYAALAATTAFSTVANLVGLTRGAGRRVAAPGGWQRPAIVTGLLASFFLVFIANLDPAHQLIERLQTIDRWNFATGVPVLGGLTTLLGGLWQAIIGGEPLPQFDWWRSSRVHIGPDIFDITEFPYFSFLFADLHPHLMGLPFFGLMIALGSAYVASSIAGLRGHTWAVAAAMGVGLGLERTLHTWDFPTAVLIVLATVFLGQLLAEGRWQRRWWDGVGQLVLAAGILVVAFAPYTAHFETYNPGLDRAPQTTKPQHYFAQFGIFLLFGLAFIVARYAEELAERRGKAIRNPILAAVQGPAELAALAAFVLGLSVFAWQWGLTVVAVSLVIELFLMNLLWLEMQRRERVPARLLATAMFVLAFGIAAGVDVVRLKDDIERMNTVFKFGLQAWQLFALASAYGAWYAGRMLWQADGWRIRPLPKRGKLAWGAASAGALLIAAGSLYLWSGTLARQDQRFLETGPTLNGLAYLPGATYTENLGNEQPLDDVPLRLIDDEPLIRWLRENVKGSPIVAESVGPLYSWNGRIASNTGLPTVIGWDWHQIQQRTAYAYLVHERRFDTQRFYTDEQTDFAEQYLLKYNVGYVVVGTEERANGTPAGIAKFTRMPSLKEVFRVGDYRIYEVVQGELPPPALKGQVR